MKHQCICTICKKEFTTSHNLQKTCSKECGKKHKKEYYKKTFTHEYRMNHGQYELYKLRFTVLQRDGFRCQYCGMTPQDKVKLQADHIIPKAKDGKNVLENLITSCEICNKGKRDVLLDQHTMLKINGFIKH